MSNNESIVEESSGNIFADLGLEDADALLTNAELARQISATIKQRQLTQKEAAKILGVDQPKVSALSRGALKGFSTERLLHYLSCLHFDVEIKIKPSSNKKRPGRIVVSAP